MLTERLSLAMNQRGQLYKGQPLYQIVHDSGNTAAVEAFNEHILQQPWAVYRVRRIYKARRIQNGDTVTQDPNKKGTVDRCVEKLDTFSSADEAVGRLHELAQAHGSNAYEVHTTHLINQIGWSENHSSAERLIGDAAFSLRT